MVSDIINSETIRIFNEMQKLETREEMVDYLRSLPRYDGDV